MIGKTNQPQHFQTSENALAYKVIVKHSAEKELARLDHKIQKLVVGFLLELQDADNPRLIGDGRAMRGENRRWRYRLGDYRIVCEIDDKIITIAVVRIRHRSSVYK